jgi:hypothetical protein
MTDATIPEAKPIRRRATVAETIKCHELLTEHLDMIGPKLCRYKGEHTDKSIAALINHEFSPFSVERIRSEMFGDLAKGDFFPAPAALAEKVERMEFTVIETAGEVASLRVKISDLQEGVGALSGALRRVAEYLNSRRSKAGDDPILFFGGADVQAGGIEIHVQTEPRDHA